MKTNVLEVFLFALGILLVFSGFGYILFFSVEPYPTNFDWILMLFILTLGIMFVFMSTNMGLKDKLYEVQRNLGKASEELRSLRLKEDLRKGNYGSILE